MTRYEAEAARLLPEGVELFDAHVHVGADIDGMVAPLDDLLATFARANIKRAFAFCMDEPDREPGFRAPNDRTLAAAEASDGVLIPFVRLDLTHEPDRGGGALPRPRRPRDQAPPALAELQPHRRPPRADLRARGRAARADPDPRRPRPAADRRRARAARGRPPRRAADHRPRRHRRPRRPVERVRGPAGRLLRHVRLEPDRPARRLPALLARAGALRVRLPVRPAADRAPHGARRRRARPGSRRAAPRRARRHRQPHRRGRADPASSARRASTGRSSSRSPSRASTAT